MAPEWIAKPKRLGHVSIVSPVGSSQIERASKPGTAFL